jgi:hypothetical protein
MGGRIFLVANRQLPYEAELDELGLVWRKPVEDATYKLLFAEKRLERPVLRPGFEERTLRRPTLDERTAESQRSRR